jgi:uncharacterized membrane protein YqjE
VSATTPPQPGYDSDRARPTGDGDRSIGELIGEVTSGLSTLVRQELELAKVEAKAEATKAGKGAGLLAGAGVAGHLVLVFLSLAVMFALDNAMGTGWAALVVTLVWAVVAAVLASVGRKKLKTVSPKPEQTVQSLKEDAQWVRAQKS